MTGYGKAECLIMQGKVTIEIKSVNSKSADISLKTNLIPREREALAKQLISSKLKRGNIDLYTSFESNLNLEIKNINKDIFCEYYRQFKDIADSLGEKSDFSTLALAISKLPDILESNSTSTDDLVKESNWLALKECIESACDSLTSFREEEGQKLKQDIEERIALILEYLSHAEEHEQERVDSIKERIETKIKEYLPEENNRFEQEIIYYLEKLDITEEKVRLRQHCKYFIETIESEECPGKKLGFIAQEIGREINTLGSKANHAQIQQWVVRMKDELEKIKEQSLNIL